MIRLFIGIVPPAHIIKDLCHTVALYKKEKWSGHVKWVRRNNIHLTLKFIGNIDSSNLNVLIDRTEKSISGFKPFTLFSMMIKQHIKKCPMFSDFHGHSLLLSSIYSLKCQTPRQIQSIFPSVPVTTFIQPKQCCLLTRD